MKLPILLSVLSVLTSAVSATGPLNGLPVLNGPIPTVGNAHIEGLKTRVGDFVHPGLWHTHDDLERIRDGVLNGVDPWKTIYAKFANDSYSQSTYVMQGPKPVLCRGACSNYTTFTNDVRAAYQNALMWYITKDQAHWNRSTTLIDAWGTTLTSIIGTDTSLLVGLEGVMLANAAEIMRWEGGWVEQGAIWYGGSGYSNQLYWLFARQSIIIGQANYGMISIGALLAFSVYLDDISMYNYAINAYQNDLCAGLFGNFDTETGQSSETGRDQGHAVSGIGWTAQAARVIQSQDTDAYAWGDNLLMKASEYAAQYNLGFDVPYDPTFYRCEAILINGPWSEPSPIDRGIGIWSTGGKSPGVWDIIYWQFVVKRGYSAPWTVKAKAAYDAAGGEVTATGNVDDLTSWGDLLWSYPGRGNFVNNNNATIWGGGTIGPNGTGMYNSD